MTGALQEAILSTLIYDYDNGKKLKEFIDSGYFELYYRDIAEACYQYYDNYLQAPGEHATDIFNEIIARNDDLAPIYQRLAESIISFRDEVNPAYVIDKSREFIRRQKLKRGLLESAQLLQNNESEDAIDRAESVIKESMVEVVSLEDVGTFLGDVDRSLRFLDLEYHAFPCGIPELDKRNLGPSRKQLHMLMGVSGAGKSWWFVHLGKVSLMHRLKVLHVTLEMSEEEVCKRYVQALFSMATLPGIETVQSFFQRDERGWFTSGERRQLAARPSFQDTNIRTGIAAKIERLRSKALCIKQFPTGALTVPHLRTYLRTLEMGKKFRPDIVMIDYPDLMELDSKHLRHETGKVYKDLRGMAIEEDIAVCVVSQTNRKGVGSKVITEENIGEDFSKFQTTDVALGYGRTTAERKTNTARIDVMKGRGSEDKFTVLLSQNFTNGQFVIDSVRMADKYWQFVEPSSD